LQRHPFERYNNSWWDGGGDDTGLLHIGRVVSGGKFNDLGGFAQKTSAGSTCLPTSPRARTRKALVHRIRK
jgi:hypothetical protein